MGRDQLKIALLVIFLLMTALGLAACAEAESSVIKIGVLRVADSVPLYVADRDGLFRENGIAVELVEFGSASDQSKAAEAGELDGLMTDLVVQSLINKTGGDLRVIATALGAGKEEGRFMVVSSPGSMIMEPEDLEGKSVGVAQGTMMEFLLDSYCEELGIDVETLRKVQIPKLSLRLDMVLQGKDIQAAVLPDPLAAFAVKEQANIVIDDTKLQANYSQSVVAVSQSLLERRQAELQSFLKGYNEAVARINREPEKYKEYFLQIAGVPAELADSYPVSAYTPGAVPDKDYVERINHWMVKKKLLDEPQAYEETVASSFAGMQAGDR